MTRRDLIIPAIVATAFAGLWIFERTSRPSDEQRWLSANTGALVTCVGEGGAGLTFVPQEREGALWSVAFSNIDGYDEGPGFVSPDDLGACRRVLYEHDLLALRRSREMAAAAPPPLNYP